MKYLRPFFDEYIKTKVNAPVRYPYSVRLLHENDTFSLFILDGGAFFFLNEFLGQASGSAVLEALDSGRLLAPWTVDNELRWDHIYDSTINSQGQPAFEQHVWLNRLYFLLPVAQEFFKTGNDKLARLWYKYLVSWDKAHEFGPQMSPQETKHCWRDMQITWRLLVMIYSIGMLGGSKSLTKSQWRNIYRILEFHSRHVLSEAEKSIANGHAIGNHFLQKATALMYCAVLFPEFEHAEKMMQVAREGLKLQFTTELYDDGGNVEASPSYSFFIARLYLDAYLLLKDNNHKSLPGLKRAIQKQYRHLEQLTTPQGLTLQISDSYALDAKLELQLVRQLFELPAKSSSKSVCFPASKIAVLRNKRMEVYVDVMERGLWHHHAGRPNVLIYIDGNPFMVDSGVCNYDSSARVNWFKTPQAHNVLIVTNPDEPASQPQKSACTIKKITQDQVQLLSEVSYENWSYRWLRKIELANDKIVLVDTVTSSTTLDIEQRFHFADINANQLDPSKVAFQMPQTDVTLITSKPPLSLGYRPAYGSNNKPYTAPELISQHQGKKVTIRTVLTTS